MLEGMKKFMMFFSLPMIILTVIEIKGEWVLMEYWKSVGILAGVCIICSLILSLNEIRNKKEIDKK